MREDTKAILSTLRQNQPALCKDFPIRGLALFGSFARDEANQESDVDILIDVEPSIGLEFVTLANRLELLLGRKVDLVSRRSLKPSLLKKVEADLLEI